MVSVLHRKLLRELNQSRWQLLAIAALITSGISCYVGLLSTYEDLERTRVAYYAECRMADFWIGLKKAPRSALDELAPLPGIADLRARIRFEITVNLDQVDHPVSGRLLSLPEQRQSVINGFVLRRGSYFTGESQREVIIDEAFADEHQLDPGDTLELLLNGRLELLSIVGTASSSEFTYLIGPGSLIPDPRTYGVFYVQQEFAESLYDFEGACNEVIGTVAPETDVTRLLIDIEERLDDYGVAAVVPLKDQVSHFMLVNEIVMGRKMAVTLSSIFLLVSALILNILMTRFVEQQRTIVGTLKAIGVRQSRITLHYMSFGLAVGFAGSLLGCLAGNAMAGGLTSVYSQYYSFPVLEHEWSLRYSLEGTLIGMLASLSGCWRGVRAVARLHPAEAMRPAAPRRGHHILLERAPVIWTRLGFESQLVLRDLFRYRARTLAGLFASTMGAAMLLTALYYRDSLIHLVKFQYELVDRSDYQLVLRDETPGEVLDEIRQLPGVNHVEPSLAVACRLVNGHRSRRVSIIGIPADSQLNIPRTRAGIRIPIPESGLILDQRIADSLGLELGDPITMIPVRGDRTPRKTTLAQITHGYLGTTIYAQIDELNRLIHEQQTLNLVLVKSDPAVDINRQFKQELKTLPALQALNDTRQARQNLEFEIIRNLNVMTWWLIFFSGLIFFGSIINSTLVTLSERAREIATLRVVGYQMQDVGRLFLREILWINLTGSLLGLPVGYALSAVSAEAFSSDLFRMPLKIEWTTWLLTPTLSLVFCLLSHQIVERRLKHMDWRSALMIKE